MANGYLPAGAEKFTNNYDYFYDENEDDYYEEYEDEDDDEININYISENQDNKIDDTNKDKALIRICDDDSNDSIIIKEELRRLAQVGNLTRFQLIVENQTDLINTIFNPCHWTCLMYAAYHGHYEFVKYCLDNSADPNYKDQKDSRTALMLACASMCDEEKLLLCVQHLLQYGANINDYDKNGISPLIFAVKNNHVKIVDHLIKNGANIDHSDFKGYSALHWAASEGFGKTILLLINNKCNFDLKSWSEETAADIALKCGYIEINNILKKLETQSNKSNELRIDSEDVAILENIKPKFDKSLTKLNNDEYENDARPGSDHLSLFLKGLKMTEYSSLFEVNDIEFKDLFLLNEQDLENIGVKKVIDRKKILNCLTSSVKQKWTNDSLMNVNSQDYISCPDMVNLIDNISMHLSYIDKSVVFLKQKIDKDPVILEYSKETGDVRKLYNYSFEALENTRKLFQSLRIFTSDLNRMKNKVELIPSDFIQHQEFKLEDDIKTNNFKIKKFISFTFITLTATVFLLKYKTFFNIFAFQTNSSR